MNPQFPIYIVSKGRWHDNRRLTARELERLSIPYTIVVEEQEYDQYAQQTHPKLGTVLILDPTYQREYETCDDLGDSKSKGPGPARNFVWDHASTNGHAWHWVMDDNILHFCTFNQNKKPIVDDGSLFRYMEQFVLRYQNVAMSGPAYRGFVASDRWRAPYVLNTRIYSCNLIRNDTGFRWRGRYNEDTILSLDMLKAGWCTIQFNAFLQDKKTTQSVKGGNTDEFYASEGTLPKSQMLVQEHSDVARLAWKLNRWHHHVDYSVFRWNHLEPCAEVSV